MKTLLVLAPHPELAEGVKTALNAEQYRVIHRLTLDEAEPLLGPGIVDACLLDAELDGVGSTWTVEKIRRRAPQIPLLIFTGARQWEWEEEAYLHGVAHVLIKPVRGRLLQAILERLWPAAPALKAERKQPVAPRNVPEAPRVLELPQRQFQALEVMRDFSAILTHSLCAEAMLKQFLLFLRELIGVNRAVIFLRQPQAGFGGVPRLTEQRRLRSACAIGLPSGLLEHFELTFDSGIGGYLFRQGRILRRDGDVSRDDPEVQKEFELLGAEVAVPILDRETLVGVAAFDGRVTGEPLVNAELELIFHLLEELGLAVRNIWLHDQLSANHEMMADILRQLSSACVVVNRDLAVLHANKTARKYFARSGRKGDDLEFGDLPQVIGAKIYQVLKTGAAVAPFRFEPPEAQGTVYQVTVVPFQRQDAALPSSALLVVEDHTQREQLQRLEVETANLRLIKNMSEHLAHEIGNALVPISTCQQMLAAQSDDADTRLEMAASVEHGIRRISRLTNQMLILAQDTAPRADLVPLEQLVEEACRDARTHATRGESRVHFDKSVPAVTLIGDQPRLRHALAEIVLNALQAAPGNEPVRISTFNEVDDIGGRWARIEVRDAGAGFSAEAARKAGEPFYSTRNVGLGLGLAVARKIIEAHRGRVEIISETEPRRSLVRVSLPMGEVPAPSRAPARPESAAA